MNTGLHRTHMTYPQCKCFACCEEQDIKDKEARYAAEDARTKAVDVTREEYEDLLGRIERLEAACDIN